jgi:plasmid maintenance system antidote protein VapI
MGASQKFGAYFKSLLEGTKNPWTGDIGVSQYALRENLKIPQSTLSGICAGRVPLSFNVALTLEEHLCIDAYEILSQQLKFKIADERERRKKKRS